MENKEIMNDLMENIIKRNFDENLKVENFRKSFDWGRSADFKIVVPQERGNNVVSILMGYLSPSRYEITAERPFKDILLEQSFFIEDIKNADEVDRVISKISRFLFIEDLIFIDRKSADRFDDKLNRFVREKFNIKQRTSFYDAEENKLCFHFGYEVDDENDYKTALICLTQEDDGDMYIEIYTRNSIRKERLINKDILLDLIYNDMMK